jgi:hypothetical protein
MMALVAYVDRASGTVTLDPHVQIPGRLGGPSEMWLLYVSRNGAPTEEAREQAARWREAGWHVNVRGAPIASRPVVTTPTQPVRSRAVISAPELTARTAAVVAMVGSIARVDLSEVPHVSRHSLAIKPKRRRCQVCGMVTVAPSLGLHQKRSGHVGFEEVNSDV